MKSFYPNIRILFFSFLFFATGFFTFAQETNNWYFGYPGGLRINFNSGAPVVTGGYPLITSEGSSSISDASGNPLMYTSGVNIWDASTNTTFNGTTMLGGGSSSQSAIIMPKPGAAGQFLVFTSNTDPGDGTANGLNYYTVTGTLGAYTLSGATSLATGADIGEGMCVIGSTDPAISFWVVVRERSAGGSLRFRSYPVSTAGVVGTTPQYSSIAGSVNFSSYICYMKTNLCQTKLAISYLNAGVVEVYNFNALNGQVTARTHSISASNAYGVEFSPNDNYLYFSQLNEGVLHQYTLGTSTDFTYAAWGGEMGQMQLGPDNRIYIARVATNYLGVIANPNNAPAAGNLNTTGLSLPSNAYRGLPTFPKFLITGLTVNPASGGYCTNTDIPMTSVFAGSLNTLNWTITPGTSGVNWTYTSGNSSSASPTIRFLTPGTYTVTLTVTDNCSRTFTEERTFVIVDPETPSGSISCGGTSITLQNNNSDPDASKYIWYRNSVAEDNIIGVGSPVNYELGVNSSLPANICLSQAASVPTTTSGSGSVSSAASNLTSAWVWASNASPYTSPTFSVLSDILILRSFDIRVWTGCNNNLTVRVRQGATTWFTRTLLVGPTCGTTTTIPVNVTLQPGTGYYIELTGSMDFYGGSVGGSNGQITYGTNTSGSVTNLVYDYRNFTVTNTCVTTVCYPVTCVLPVSLTDFTGKSVGNTVALHWITASEKNNAFFEVQHSIDGIHFQTIGNVDGAGNSNSLLTYGLTDFSPVTGLNYYRLVQHDINGESHTSNIISVLFNNEFDFTVIPNPSTSTFTLVSNMENISLVISDVTGRELFRSNNTNEFEHFGSQLPKGVYVVTVSSSGHSAAKKIVKE